VQFSEDLEENRTFVAVMTGNKHDLRNYVAAMFPEMMFISVSIYRKFILTVKCTHELDFVFHYADQTPIVLMLCVNYLYLG
jgi:hypothetical protein